MGKPSSSLAQITQLKERVHQLETCYKITSLLNSELNLANLLDTIMNIAKKVMKADACSLLLLDEDNRELIFQVALSDVSAKLKNMVRLRVGQGIAGTVAKTGRPLILKDAYTHPKFNPDYDKKTGFKTGSLMCAPLKAKDKIIGVCQVIHGKKKRKVFLKKDLELFQLFCDSAALAIQNAQMHQVLMANQRFEKDMEFAQSVQASFLPESPPQDSRFIFGARTHPAQVVGGDYYDFIPFDENTLGIVLGDVSGKGVPAALQMARLMSDFRYISQIDPSPATVLREVNNILCERSYRGMFTTTVYLLLDLKKKTVQAANAGHSPLLLRNKRKSVKEVVQAGGTPLGILPGVAYDEETITLHSGDRILIYTDGITEPKNKKNQEFGLERLQKLFRNHSGSPDQLIESIDSSVRRFIGKAPQFDDFTCVSFQVI